MKTSIFLIFAIALTSLNCLGQNKIIDNLLDRPVTIKVIDGDTLLQRDLTDYLNLTIGANDNQTNNIQSDAYSNVSILKNYFLRPHPSVLTTRKYFDQASIEFGVPVSLLMVIGQIENNWTQTGPTIDYGWGIMHLVKNSYCNTLESASQLLGVSEEVLKDDALQNIRGAAALIASYAGKERSNYDKLEDWFPALAEFSGLISLELRNMQALNYYETLKRGVRAATVWGEEIVIEPIKDIELNKINQNFSNENNPYTPMSSDYGPALLNLAASCNYATGRTYNIDTWVNHYIGTGTYLGTISWFQTCPCPSGTCPSNCPSGYRGCQGSTPIGPSSAHFVIKNSNGEITQMVLVANTAWHCGATGFAANNPRSIGVEHEATAANPSMWNSVPMLQASATMACYFQQQFNFPTTQNSSPGICGHNNMPGTSTLCPGPLPWTTWFSYFNSSPGCSSGNTPANDNCSGAVQFPSLQAGTCTGVVSGEDVNGATQSLTPNQCTGCNCTSPTAMDVWFKFTAINTSHTIQLSNLNSFDAVIEIRQGSSCNGSYLQCYDPSGSPSSINYTYNSFTPGQTYYIRVFDYGSTPPAVTTFDICVNSPTNSLPDLVITSGTQSATPSTVSAGSDITAFASENNSGTGTSGPNVVGLWLSSNSTLSGSDTYLGDISGFPSLAPNSNSVILNASVNIPSTIAAGNYYLFFWADGDEIINESDDGNNFASTQITVTTPTCSQPSNDGCSGSFAATPLAFGSSCNPISSTSCGATSSGFSSCAGTQDDDVFFSFIPTSTTATINVVSSAGYDAVYQVLTGPCGGSMVQVGDQCIDDGGTGDPETSTFSGLTIGNTYFIRVWHYGSGYGTTGNFTICVYGCPTPATPATPTSNSPQCGSVTITRSGSPPSGETWYWQGTSCGTSTTLGSGTTYSATTSGTYYIRSFNSACGTWSPGCGSTTITVYPTPATPATPTSNSPQCGSVTITRTGSPPAGETWYWQGTSCGTSTTLGSGTTYSATSSGTYYIRSYNSACGTWSSACGSVAVTVYPAPATPANPTSNSPQCGSVTITRTGSPPSGETWYWQGTSCGTSTTLGSGTTYSATSSGTYHIRSFNSACGTWSPGCGNVAVVINTIPGSVSVSGGGTSCNSAILTASGGTGGTIYWQGTTSNGTSTATPSTSQTVTASGTYYFRAYNSCGWGSQGSATVNINSSPSAVTVSGGGTYCNSSTLTASGGSGGTIYWQGTTSNGTSTATPSTSQTVNASGTYYFRAYNSCGWGTEGSTSVIVDNELPVSVIVSASANPVCLGTSVTFTATPTNGGTSPTYQWKRNGTDVGTNNPIYTLVPNNNDLITCELSSSLSCATGNPATSNPITMTVNPTLPVSVSIAASANPVCSGISVTLTAIPTNGGTSPTYQWKRNGTNAGTNSPTYVLTPNNNDVITCVLTSNLTCVTGNPASSNSISMAVNPVPPQPGDISGNSSVCQGTPQTYSIQPVSGATSYTWSLPQGWTGNSTTTSIATTVGPNSGTISVVANNACGPGPVKTLNVGVTTVPVQPGVISGNTTSSQGITEIYSIESVPGATSYVWTLPAGWSGSSTTASITTTVGASGGSVTVAAVNACGTSTTRTLSVNVSGTPYIIVSPENLTFENVHIGSFSTPQSYDVTGSNLTSPVSISAPTGFTVSANITGPWTSSLSIPQINGSTNSTVYVRFSPTNAMVYSGNISNSSTGANVKNVAVSGTGVENIIPVITNSVNGNIDVHYSQLVTPTTFYQVIASNLSDNLTISASTQSSTPDNCQLVISLSPDGAFSSILTIAPVNGSVNSIVYVRPSCDDVPVYITGTIIQSSPGASNDVINAYFENEYYYLFAPVVTIGDIQATAGQVVYIPMTATNFDSIGFAEYYIDYNPNVLSYIGIENAHESLPFYNVCNNCSDPYSCCPIDPNDYILSNVTAIDQTHYRLYIKAKLEVSQFNVPDGQKVFDLVFNYSGGYSDLTFSGGEYYYSGNPGPFYNPEIINEPFANYYINGSVGPEIKTLNLSLNLEGLFSPALGKMRKARGETGEYFSGTIADQITVKLASGTFPYSFVFETDSIELDQDGHCTVNVPIDLNGSYYIVVSHRNSIETWTASPIPLDGNGVEYDFTLAINSTYGDNMKFINGTYCFYGGDVNQDGSVDTGDMSIVDNESSNFTAGYISADVNGDGIVDTGDMIILDNNGSSFIGSVTPVGSQTLPEVSTTPVTNISQNTAISGGIVISQGSSPVSLRGVCWGLSSNPVITDNHTTDGSGSGSYLSTLHSLMPGTTYHLRAYATNNTGTSYGTDISFTTNLFSPGGGVTDIDGNVYTSVILGNQEWLVQNLKTTHFANGEIIPNITDNTQWGNLTSSACSWYNNSNQFENPYGKLYNWYSVADARHLCPAGWHVPTDQEWTILTDYLGGLSVADEKLKEAGIAHWPDPNNGTNASGMTGIPGGNRNYLGVFTYFGQRTYWWSSSEYNSDAAWGRSLGYDFINATTGYYYKKNGYSVRCIKD